MKRAPRFEAVVFDFGNVLALLDRTEICRRFAVHSSRSVDEIGPLIFGGDIEQDSETGAYDSHEMFRRVRERIGGRPDWQYEQFVEEMGAGLRLNPEGVHALEFAANRSRTFALSDTSYVHALWLFRQEVLTTLLENFFFSFKLGRMKPDPALFRTVIHRTGVDAQRIIFVDDLRENTDAAARLGVATIRYTAGVTDLVRELSGLLDP